MHSNSITTSIYFVKSRNHTFAVFRRNDAIVLLKSFAFEIDLEKEKYELRSYFSFLSLQFFEEMMQKNKNLFVEAFLNTQIKIDINKNKIQTISCIKWQV